MAALKVLTAPANWPSDYSGAGDSDYFKKQFQKKQKAAAAVRTAMRPHHAPDFDEHHGAAQPHGFSAVRPRLRAYPGSARKKSLLLGAMCTTGLRDGRAQDRRRVDHRRPAWWRRAGRWPAFLFWCPPSLPHPPSLRPVAVSAVSTAPPPMAAVLPTAHWFSRGLKCELCARLDQTGGGRAYSNPVAVETLSPTSFGGRQTRPPLPLTPHLSSNLSPLRRFSSQRHHVAFPLLVWVHSACLKAGDGRRREPGTPLEPWLGAAGRDTLGSPCPVRWATGCEGEKLLLKRICSSRDRSQSMTTDGARDACAKARKQFGVSEYHVYLPEDAENAEGFNRVQRGHQVRVPATPFGPEAHHVGAPTAVQQRTIERSPTRLSP